MSGDASFYVENHDDDDDDNGDDGDNTVSSRSDGTLFSSSLLQIRGGLICGTRDALGSSDNETLS